MTDAQILELGFKALLDKLGPVGMVRFIHQFRAVQAITPKIGSNGSACPMLRRSRNRSNRLKMILSVPPKPLKR